MNPIVQNGLALFSGRNKSDHFKFIPASQVILTFSFLLAFGWQVHGQIATTTTLTSNKTIFCLNEPVTLTATSDQIIAVGNVQFLEGSTILGNALLDATGIATLTISNLSYGNHTLMAVYEGMTPFNGSTSADITLSVITNPVINAHPSPRTVGIGCNATFSVTADDIVPLTYQWRKDGFDIPGANSPSLIINNVLLTDDGIYDVVVSGLCGNTTSDPSRLTVTPILNVALTSKTNVICFGGATGMIDITADGGLAPYTYAWSGTGVNATAEDQSGLAAGNYSVIVTDANGCSTTPLPITITEPSSPVTVSLDSKTNVLCFGASTGAINISASGGTGPYNFAWTGAGVSVNGEDQTGLAAGNYSVIVTDANGCSTASLPVTITQPSSLVTVSLNSKTDVLCFGTSTGTINITPSGGTSPYYFAWTGAGVSVNSEDQSGLAAGNYSVIVTDANGCSTASLPVTITQPSSGVSVSLDSKTNVLCFGASTGAINITASGSTAPYTYTWTGAGVNASSEDQSGLAAGNYSVIAKDAIGCSSSSLPVTISQPLAITINNISSNSPVCSDNLLSLSSNATGGTGILNYSWTGPNGFASLLKNPTISNAQISASGLYILTITDGNGCSASATTNVIITQRSTASISYSGLAYCKNNGASQTVTLTGTGNYSGGTYSSSPAGLSINSSNGTFTASASNNGTYTITYTRAAIDVCGPLTATTTVTITALPVATFSYPGTPYCQNASNPNPVFSGGGIAGNFSSSAGLVFINSSTGRINLLASTPGTYTVTNTIAAAGGCSVVSASSSITITAEPSASITYTGSPFCKSVSTAQPVTLVGTGAYTGGTFSSSPSGLTLNTSTGSITPNTSTAGNYTIVYNKSAAGGCAAFSTSTVVTITTLPAATINYPATQYCSSIAAPQTVTRTGTAGGTYSSVPAGLDIDPVTGTIIPINSDPGVYTVNYTIAAANGCPAVTATRNVTIAETPTVSMTSDYCAGGGNVRLTANSTVQPVSYLWSNGATTQSILVDKAGTYTFIATTAQGCSATSFTNVAVELVTNGDFSAGNIGFTSGYGNNQAPYTGGATGLWPETLYAIDWNANLHHPNFFGKDHTTGNGNFMIVNGAGYDTTTVWRQSFAVQPNTTYYFSAWAMSLNRVAPYAQLKFT
ncbi:MAG: Ig-like domain repeat protein, partial [Chitinophagaceae bacterium]